MEHHRNLHSERRFVVFPSPTVRLENLFHSKRFRRAEIGRCTEDLGSLKTLWRRRGQRGCGHHERCDNEYCCYEPSKQQERCLLPNLFADTNMVPGRCEHLSERGKSPLIHLGLGSYPEPCKRLSYSAGNPTSSGFPRNVRGSECRSRRIGSQPHLQPTAGSM